MNTRRITRGIISAAALFGVVEIPYLVSKNPWTELRARYSAVGAARAGDSKLGAVHVLDWIALRQVDPGTIRPHASIAALNGDRVSIRGFMVPLQDLQSETTEFLLVPVPMTCVHVPPPAENQIVLVQTGAKPVKVHAAALTVTGTFYVAGTPFGTVGKAAYTIVADTVE